MRFSLVSPAPVTQLQIRLGSDVLMLTGSDLRALRAAAPQPTQTGSQRLVLEAWNSCQGHDKTGVVRTVQVRP